MAEESLLKLEEERKEYQAEKVKRRKQKEREADGVDPHEDTVCSWLKEMEEEKANKEAAAAIQESKLLEQQ